MQIAKKSAKLLEQKVPENNKKPLIYQDSNLITKHCPQFIDFN
jgi:hypothetical protein